MKTTNKSKAKREIDNMQTQPINQLSHQCQIKQILSLLTSIKLNIALKSNTIQLAL